MFDVSSQGRSKFQYFGWKALRTDTLIKQFLMRISNMIDRVSNLTYSRSLMNGTGTERVSVCKKHTVNLKRRTRLDTVNVSQPKSNSLITHSPSPTLKKITFFDFLEAAGVAGINIIETVRSAWRSTDHWRSHIFFLSFTTNHRIRRWRWRTSSIRKNTWWWRSSTV